MRKHGEIATSESLLVVILGPTGSGKTNTLYSSIAKINTMLYSSRVSTRRC